MFAAGIGGGIVLTVLLDDDRDAPRSAAAEGGQRRPLLVVTLRRVGAATPIEGAISFVRVRGPSFMRHDGRFDNQDFEVSYRVPAAGTVTLTSFQRTCGGNCGFLDPPSERCTREIEVGDDEVVRASITVDFARGCTIAVDR